MSILSEITCLSLESLAAKCTNVCISSRSMDVIGRTETGREAAVELREDVDTILQPGMPAIY